MFSLIWCCHDPPGCQGKRLFLDLWYRLAKEDTKRDCMNGTGGDVQEIQIFRHRPNENNKHEHYQYHASHPGQWLAEVGGAVL